MKPAPMTTTLASSTAVISAAQSEGVVEGAQGEQSVALAQVFGSRQRARSRTGRDDDAVALQDGAVVELDLPRLRVETDGAPTEDLVDPVFARPSLVRQHRLLGGPRPGQDLLGQRRPVVGKVPLLADQGDLPVEALRAQGLDGSPSGERGADDEDGAVGGQLVLPDS